MEAEPVAPNTWLDLEAGGNHGEERNAQSDREGGDDLEGASEVVAVRPKRQPDAPTAQEIRDH